MTAPWVKVDIKPRVWAPTDPGDAREGVLADITTADGPRGPFDVVLLADEDKRLWMVAGVRVTRAVRTAGIRPGDPLRIVFTGMVGRTGRARGFDVFTRDARDPSP